MGKTKSMHPQDAGMSRSFGVEAIVSGLFAARLAWIPTSNQGGGEVLDV